ncbi:hypothetical protein ACF09J_30565 [Streptomyces sp. NPDC014889]|uniref:hypothetical protein n=1 Tax=Streptomyces sp. NPDC014889 TaxID=3364928 RepID=UPI0037029E74
MVAGVFITTLDFFIVNVAIPSLQTDRSAASGVLTTGLQIGNSIGVAVIGVIFATAALLVQALPRTNAGT